MSTNYPGGLDDTTGLKDDANNNTLTVNTHAAAHNNVADSIIAVETELGTSPKGTYTDVKTRLNDGVVKTPGADQIVQPTGDFVGLAVRAASAQNLANLLDVRNSSNTILGFWDRLGNLSAQSFKIAGVALNSTHLNDSAALARLASPTFSGVPAAPTASVDTNTTQLATTAFVLGQAMAVGDGIPAMNGTGARGSSTHFARADHVHPSDTSRIANALLTNTGDLIYASAGNTPARRAIGTDGQVLTASGGVPIWAQGATVLLKTTQKDVVNTLTETDLLNGEITIPALSATGRVEILMTGDFLNNGAASTQITLRLKLGATTLWNSGQNSNFNTSATRRGWTLRATLFNAGVTNSQIVGGTIQFSGNNISATTGWGTIDTGATANNGFHGEIGGTSAEDTTASKALQVTVQHSVQQSFTSMRLRGAIVTVNL